jgi:hypothetical protein
METPQSTHYSQQILTVALFRIKFFERCEIKEKESRLESLSTYKDTKMQRFSQQLLQVRLSDKKQQCD